MEVPKMKKSYGVKSGTCSYDSVIIVCDEKEDADDIAAAIGNGDAEKMVVELPRIERKSDAQ